MSAEQHPHDGFLVAACASDRELAQVISSELTSSAVRSATAAACLDAYSDYLTRDEYPSLTEVINWCLRNRGADVASQLAGWIQVHGSVDREQVDRAVKAVASAHVSREAVSLMTDSISKLEGDPGDPAPVIESTWGALADTLQSPALGRSDVGLRSEGDVLMSDLDLEEDLVGVSTGYSGITSIAGHLHPGDYFVIAARPGMGKTSLAMNIAANVATAGKKVLVLSMEMPKRQLIGRLVCSHAEVDVRVVRMPELRNEATREELRRSWEIVKGWNIHVVDSGDRSPSSLAQAVARQRPDLVIVDYIQLMRPSDKGGSSGRTEDVTRISNELKEIFLRYGIPGIVIAQLNRQVESRSGPPRLSDLRDSGAIEQDADMVAFLHGSTDQQDQAPTVQFIMAKNRHGPIARALLKFNKYCTLFEDA